MKLKIADNVWFELRRVCLAAKLDPHDTAANLLRGLAGDMQKEVYRKAVLSDEWAQAQWRHHPPAYFATFDIKGVEQPDISADVAAPFVEYSKALGYDPSKLASHNLACVANGIAKKYLGSEGTAFSL